MRWLLSSAEWVRKRYSTIILITVVLGLLLGLRSTAPGRALQPYSQWITFAMILSISFTIRLRQFVLVSKQPVAVAVGLLLNFVFMPLLAWALARLLVQEPQLATGIILVGVVPCAGMAAVWIALLKGDVPLGVAINALTMVLGPFLIPPLMGLLAGSSVAINTWGMFQQLTVILLLPLALGIGLRWLVDLIWNVQPLMPIFPSLSALTAALLMFTVTNVNVPLIVARWELAPTLLLATALIFPLGFLVPYWLSRPAFAWPQRIAVTYSSGMKNLPIAVGLAFTSFPGQPLVGLPVALAFIVQMLTASLFYRYLIRQVIPTPGQDGSPHPSRGSGD